MNKQITKTKSLDELMENLTPKQAIFFDEWLKSGNGTKAALIAYETTDRKAASVIATENLAKLRNPMKTFLEHSGIGLEKLVSVVREASEAVTTDRKGKVVPDHRVRLEAVDRLTKWLDVEPNTNNLNQISQTTNYFQVIQNERKEFE